MFSYRRRSRVFVLCHSFIIIYKSSIDIFTRIYGLLLIFSKLDFFFVFFLLGFLGKGKHPMTFTNGRILYFLSFHWEKSSPF